MKQEFKLLSFIFCIGLMFSTTQAIGGFEPNIVAEQQTEFNKENQFFNKVKKISKQQFQNNRKQYKRLKKTLKNTDEDIRTLSKKTFFLGLLSIGFLMLMPFVGDILILLSFVAAIIGTIVGIKSLKRIKKSDENHKVDKIFIGIGFLLNLPAILFSLFYMFLWIFWVA